MNTHGIQSRKLKERILLIRRFLPHIEWEWPNEVKEKINSLVFGGSLPVDKSWDVESIARMIDDGKLESMIRLSPLIDYYSFRGKHYTVRRGGVFEHQGSWDEVRKTVKEILKTHGKKAYALLKALTEVDKAPFSILTARASEIYGERIYPSRLIAELRDRWDLAWEVGSRRYPAWAMPGEIKPVVVEVLSEIEAKPVPKLSTPQAEREYLQVIRMEEEYRSYLNELIRERLDETIRFGKRFSPAYLIDYLQDLFGPVIFFDELLSIAQQYSICDSSVITEKGHKAFSIGFNLALFGEPGTGKTFATKDMIIGNENIGVPPHGLPGLNRYCGGMTPAMFIAIGEAYTGRKINFIVTEFNDWFKYKGMVEPLKLAMERGTIIYETKTYKVGPYKFSSFFSVNYNTRVYEKGYSVTVSDPNFNAIEDRMLCRLHRLTKDKYRELAESQRRLMLGITTAKMAEVAPKIRDHLTLIYGIQTGHPLVAENFYGKKILLTERELESIERARELILESMGEVRVLPFSMRLERRALQLASALSLMNFFKVKSDLIPIDDIAMKMAIQFFVEEAWIRSNETFSLFEVLRKLN